MPHNATHLRSKIFLKKVLEKEKRPVGLLVY
jgi:hypothetical protein